MKFSNFFILIILLIFNSVYSQTQTFEKTFGGIYNETGHSIYQTTDGGFIIAADSFGIIGDANIYLIKIDSSANTEWTKSFGDNNHELSRCIKQSFDGGYILTGDYISSWSGTEAFLFKTNSIGDSLWTVRRFGTMSARIGISVVETSDSDIVWGTKNDDIQSYNPYQAFKYTKDGNFLWQSDNACHNYSAPFNGSSLQNTFDKGFVICGADYSSSQIGMELFKFDSIGHLQWNKFFIGNPDCTAMSVWQTTDTGYVIAGYKGDYGPGIYNWYLIKTNSNGDSLWSKTFTSQGGIQTIQQTLDGGYMIAGNTSWSAGFIDIQLMKLNANGDSMWAKTFGGINDDMVYHAAQCTDGGFIMVGYTESFGNGSRDIIVIKTDSTGNIVTGIKNETATDPDINIFPNPSTNTITINLNSNSTNFKVKLKDLNGITILQKSFVDNISIFTIDLPESISAGIYLLEIDFKENILAKKVVIVD